MAAIYPFLLFLHALTRWFVVLGGVWLVLSALGSLGRGGSGDVAPVRTPWKAYMGSIHLQLLLGIVLLFVSPLAQASFGDMGTAMKVRPMRFFVVEHTTMMLVALVVAQVGSLKSRRAITSAAAARTSLIFGGLSLLLILAAIPWPFMGEIARPWLRSW
ncbi:hypothetical protein [Luteitalea sp.]|jgi:hypothetical protein|uniref:hypothetical protein n=1 Tax=Luteitalea sp. TaxID=2004800 RepID=UPI0037CCA7BA